MAYFCVHNRNIIIVHKNLNLIYNLLKTISPMCTSVYKTSKNNLKNTQIIDDKVDDFTNRLVQDKIAKWDSINQTKAHLFALLKNSNSGNKNSTKKVPKHLINKELEVRLKQLVEERNINNVKETINECIENKIVISYDLILNLISFCGYFGAKETIEMLINYGLHMKILNENDFQYSQQYIAEAIWLQGNIKEALSIFKKLYITNNHHRRSIILLIRFLIRHTMDKRTEAILVQITQFTEYLVDNYNDFSLLIYLWESCILSEWFSDQSAALEMLEKNEQLRDQLNKKYKYVIIKLLKEKNVDVVQRLFEFFLKYNMTEQYLLVLRMLFDFYCLNRDFRHCAEIIRWCNNLKVPLSAEQNAKFIKLLLNQYGDKTEVQIQLDKSLKPPQFKLKF